MRKKLIKKLKAKKEANEIIPQLLKKAKEAYKAGNKKLSKTHSKKIIYLSMKYKIKLPKMVKKQLCKHCHSILMPSINCRVRIKEGKLIYYCLECKKYNKVSLR